MGILELTEVEKHFGGLPAVDGVTMAADDGEILAVVGPNGAGKSTLVKLIAGLEVPTRGFIAFGGKSLTGLAPHGIRHRGIAMVPQTPRIFPSMTVRENVVLGAMFGGTNGLVTEMNAVAEANQALAWVGLDNRAADRATSLNLHQQRFLELARAVAGRPRLLLLDEVMAGLNESELQSSIEIVRTLRDHLGLTVIWVEHVMKAVIDLAERVVVLDFGRVLVDGPPRKAMREQSVIDAYLGQALLDA